MEQTPSGGNVLVIGGSGFVSGTVARTAVAQGNKVWAVTRGQRELPQGVTGLVADRKDGEAFRRAIIGADVKWDLVLDCIGFEAADARQDVELFRGSVPQLVFISTDFVYDPPYRRFPQPEETEHYLSDNSYGANKRRCELEFINGDTGDMQWTIVRPCHIYGPGSQLGCLPKHSRDPQLLARMRAGETLELVGGGYFLQQPIFVRDLSALMLSAWGNERAYGQFYNAYGPDIIESRYYYKIIADAIGAELKVKELPVDQYRAEHPEHVSFLCHRIASLDKMRAHGLAVPATSIEVGLREHVQSLIASAPPPG
ncbi:MAG: NAD-dependent epimerase/dehydratase family protein [Anaerolineae bacterium]